MAVNGISLTVVGNLTADPELRFTPNGKAVVAFTLATTPRIKRGDTWEDGTPTFTRCEYWGPGAENLANSEIGKGARMIAVGSLRTDKFKDKESGEDRTMTKLVCDECGPSVQYAHVNVRKVQRQSGPAPVDPVTGETADAWARPEASADA